MSKTALVTGASRGIGRETAIALAKKGYNIVLNYKENHEAAAFTEQQIINCNVQCFTCPADVSDRDAVEQLYRKSKAVFGFVDTVVNNAGVSKISLFQEETEQDYAHIMGTNFKGVYNVCKVFSKDMICNGRGNIINISSIWGIVGASMEALYSASKAAVNGLTKALAKEFGPSGVAVNAIAPGVIETDMLQCLDAGSIQAIRNQTPLGSIGSTADVARAVLYLADSERGFVTGEILNISGGFVIV